LVQGLTLQQLWKEIRICQGVGLRAAARSAFQRLDRFRANALTVAPLGCIRSR
jgi:hypothetical protein